MLQDWQIQVRMLDFEDNVERNREIFFCEVIEKLCNMFDAEFSVVEDGGGAISNIFEAKIQDDLEEFFDCISDNEHNYCITAINTNLCVPYVWHIEKGETTFEETCDFIDAYGNNCFLDSSSLEVKGIAGGENIYALPVKKMIEEEEGDSDGCGRIFKANEILENYFSQEEIDTYEFSDYLRTSCVSGYYGEEEGFLLDKNGKPVTSLKDFDHSDPDEDGYIYYPVPASDLEDGYGEDYFTEEAVEKWKKKLGL